MTPEELFQAAYRAHQGRDAKRAEQLYLRYLKAAPGDTDACNLLGLLYLDTGKPEKAVPWISKAVSLLPRDAQAHYNLGLALKEVDRLSQACSHFRNAAKLEPGNPEPANALGNVLRQLEMPDAAVEAFRAALSADASHGPALAGLADAVNEMGVAANAGARADEALALFEEATTIDANNADAWINLGILREQTGEIAAAAKAYRAAITARPGFADAHFHLAHLSDEAISDQEMSEMQALANSPGLDDKAQALLAYGMACGFEKQGDYIREFDALRRAHGIKAGQHSFDIENIQRRFAAIAEVFADTAIAPADNDQGSGLVFVVGMPRSGTTLTEQILASHPRAHGCGESGIIARAAIDSEKISGEPYPTSIKRLSADKLRELAETAQTAFDKRAGDAAIAIDTTPTNFLQCGLIARLWPSARVIHCVRHPLDVCLSIYQNALSDDHAYAHDFATLGQYFVAYDQIMQHWTTTLPGRIFELRYDRLVLSFEATVRDLLEFCDLPFDERCLRFHETQRVVKTPSAGQVRKPIYAGSLDRWKKYEKPLAELRQLLSSQINRFEQASTHQA